MGVYRVTVTYCLALNKPRRQLTIQEMASPDLAALLEILGGGGAGALQTLGVCNRRGLAPGASLLAQSRSPVRKKDPYIILIPHWRRFSCVAVSRVTDRVAGSTWLACPSDCGDKAAKGRVRCRR